MILGFDSYNNMEVPQFILCKPNGERMCSIPCTEKKGTIKFNDYDEISFTTYLYIDGKKNEAYEKVNELMHVELPEIGRYVISDVNINSEGTDFEYKECVAMSEEILMAQKYLENFMINTAETGSVEKGDSNESVEEYKKNLIQFYDENNRSKSLLNLILDEKCPDWTIDPSGFGDLKQKQRVFNVDRQDVYSFLTKDVSEAFECIFVFDTIRHTVGAYPEDKVGNDTDIHISYANLEKNASISSSTDDIKTCLKLVGKDNLNVREVNMGKDEIYNIDYFHSLEYMSKGLYDAYKAWKEKWLTYEAFYDFLSYGITDKTTGLSYKIDRENKRVYAYKSDDPNGFNVWCYYTLEGDAEEELKGVQLVDGDNITNQQNLIWGHQRFYDKIYYLTSVMMPDKPEEIKKVEEELKKKNPKDYSMYEDGEAGLTNDYLDKVLFGYGLEALKSKKEVYNKERTVLMESEIGMKDHTEHWKYWNITCAIRAASTMINRRTAEIDAWKNIQAEIKKQMDKIVNDLDMRNGKNFTKEQLQELAKFIREDELSDDNFSVNSIATYKNRYDWLNDFLEHGRKELAKVSIPTLEFSMDMVNIYAVPEFQDKFDKFEVGNYMYVTLRDDFSLKVRLLTIDINFLDVNDFSVSFGNVAKLKGNKLFQDVTEALSLASDAATSVSYNASYWNQANVDSTTIGDMINDGLLAAGNSLYTTESDVVIDQYGITIQNNPTSDAKGNKLYPDDTIFLGGGQILFSSDGLKTIRAALGRVKYKKNEYDEETGLWKKDVPYDVFGLIAETVLSGYIGGSTIQGSTIIGGKIYSPKFEHNEKANSGKGVYNGTRINLEEGTFEFNGGGKQRLTLTKDDKDEFTLTVKGTIEADKGHIGGDNGFIIGSNGTNGYMYTAGKLDIDYKPTLKENNVYKGIYIGSNGIGLGYNENTKKALFSVTPDGNLIARTGEIGGFMLNDKAIYKNKKSLTDTNPGVYIGTDGIALGASSAFHVTNEGTLTAKRGYIGGATITDDAIYVSQPKTKNTRNTSTTGEDEEIKWRISSNGSATFTNIHISGVQPGSSFGGVSYDNGSTYFGGSNGINFNGSGVFGNFGRGFSADSSFVLINNARTDFDSLVLDTLVVKDVFADYVSTEELDAYEIRADKIKTGEINNKTVGWKEIEVITNINPVPTSITVNGSPVQVLRDVGYTKRKILILGHIDTGGGTDLVSEE